MNEALAALAGLCSSAFATVLVQRAALLYSLSGAGASARGGSLPGDALAALAGTQMFALFRLFTARPFTSFFLCLCIGLLLLALNRVKETVLREPLVLVDIYLLPQVFRYPELYFPFLPLKLLAGGAGAALLALGLMLLLEPPLLSARNPGWMVAGLLLFLAPIALAAVMNKGRLAFLNEALLRACPVSHDAVGDARRNGPLASALMHPLLAGKYRREGRDFLLEPDRRPAESRWPENFELPVLEAGQEARDTAPHVVILQAESFFDIRPALSPELRETLAGFLPNWDALAARGNTLPTPSDAFGAYTMRTEFGVLTGLDDRALGPWAFNPYLLAASRPMWSLAGHFRQQGYATFCIHPYHKEFFCRHKVMPHLGFEAFLSLEDLGHLPRFGPYVSDTALGQDILSRLDASVRPVFCFAVSMEAHGPWLPGRLNPEQIHETLGDIDHHALEPQLRLYLCHLRRMDRMLGLFRQRMDTTGGGRRKCLFWAYGDHAPALRTGTVAV